MDGYDETTYGERVADVYDSMYEKMFDVESTVTLLAGLAGTGSVLELAIGTGRIALPLAARGVSVSGVDSSPAMVAKLRAKQGGEAIPVTMGNFADVPVDGAYSLIFVAFNTFFALGSQEEQIRCFENVATHLTDDGMFLIEGFVPDLARFDRDQSISATHVATDTVRFDVSTLDRLNQAVDSQHVFLTEQGIKLVPVRLRFAWPSELDLMARLAGLRLQHRWGGYGREPFTSASARHVSVYTR